MKTAETPNNSVEQYIILGDPNRKGMLKKANKLSNFLTSETSIKTDFLPSGSSVEEMTEKLLSKEVDQIPTGAIILGGDATVNHALEASRIINNHQYFNIITNYFGGARDIFHSVSSTTSSTLSLENIIYSNNEGLIHPVEVELNDYLKFYAYNVFSIGRIALMANQIDLTREKFKPVGIDFIDRALGRSYETFDIIRNKLLQTIPFELKTIPNGPSMFLGDLIATNSQRFGILFRSTNDILDHSFGIHHIDKIDPEIIRKIIFQRPFSASLNVKNDQEVSYFVTGEGLKFQIDGEVYNLEDGTNKISLRNASKPAKLLLPK